MAKFSGVCGRTTTDLEQKMFRAKGLQKWGLGSGLLGLGVSGGGRVLSFSQCISIDSRTYRAVASFAWRCMYDINI